MVSNFACHWIHTSSAPAAISPIWETAPQPKLSWWVLGSSEDWRDVKGMEMQQKCLLYSNCRFITSQQVLIPQTLHPHQELSRTIFEPHSERQHWRQPASLIAQTFLKSRFSGLQLVKPPCNKGNIMVHGLEVKKIGCKSKQTSLFWMLWFATLPTPRFPAFVSSSACCQGEDWRAWVRHIAGTCPSLFVQGSGREPSRISTMRIKCTVLKVGPFFSSQASSGGPVGRSL